jgi:preprotein translocase subunit SecE
MKKIREFFSGVKKEMAKVHWPTRKELTKYSIATLSFILIYSLYFFLADAIIAVFKMLVS